MFAAHTLQTVQRIANSLSIERLTVFDDVQQH